MGSTTFEVALDVDGLNGTEVALGANGCHMPGDGSARELGPR
ncbi:hypothetical protein ACLESD_02055 [Pyxidicoccus sp. 3LFB2]